jgi:hypothetical protein
MAQQEWMLNLKSIKIICQLYGTLQCPKESGLVGSKT